MKTLSKSRIVSFVLAMVTVLTMIPMVSASAAENYNGGWAMMSDTRTVYTDSSLTQSKGTVFKDEGITVLSYSGNIYHIEYSTSNGTKDGYVLGGVNDVAVGVTCVATVNVTTNLYYGTNAALYDVAGTVFAGEHVSIIGANAPWAYVEYNTNAGRKRGYIEMSKITLHNQPAWMPDLYERIDPSNWTEIPTSYDFSYDVLAGPSDAYPVIGSVDGRDGTLIAWYEQEGEFPFSYYYITYVNANTGLKKSGFVKFTFD